MNKTILIIDDDDIFAQTLKRSFIRRGYEAWTANNISEAAEFFKQKPDFAVIDLKIDDESGLNALSLLIQRSPDTKALILTGYSSISTAVKAIKLGAQNYLCKPANTDEILKVLTDAETTQESVTIEEKPISVDRLEWEHIQRVLNEHEGNISATARALNMHRRTLQRKLQKRPVNR
ncbi:response regulator transcription factor [Alkalimarinus sediminis]|uniref:Response regulator transcription factor n=1 Tax=Alkalimarinus sediminis TaxID=1632866 RepID=A0A9E8HP36_9ALTE|nr:response regulator transcription factor [Alkalimarinus sediminis]UZW73871.1 response regulator transcription factor [Alkalimarinus sediminis]